MQGVEAHLDRATLPAQLRLQDLSGESKIHRYSVIDHFGGLLNYTMFNNSYRNLTRALSERVFQVKMNGTLRPPPRPTVNVAQTFAQFFTTFQTYVTTTAPLTLDQVPLLYTGRKRRIYEEAVESLRLKALSIEDSFIKAFVKIEKLCTSLKQFLDIVPRVIQPRTPRYCVELARYIKPIEHLVYDIIDLMFLNRPGAVRPEGEKSIMKGLNAKQVAANIISKINRYEEFVFIGMDAKRFDQHVSREMLEWEHTIYQLFYTHSRRASRRLTWLLNMQLENTGFGYFKDGIIKYTTDGARMSGDMNTGLGNCLLMCTMLWSYFETLGIEYDIINNGDDCGIIMARSNYHLFDAMHCKAWFLTVGFQMDIEAPVYVIEEIEFCQSHPVCVDGEWVMVRGVDAAVTKDSMSVQVLTTVHQWCEHWESVGRCGISLSSGVPMNQAYYSRLVELAEENKPADYDEERSYNQHDLNQYGFAQMAKGLTGKVRVVSDETRLSFYKAFKILPDMQIEMENYYKNIQLTPQNIVSDDYEVLKTPFRCCLAC